MKLKSILCSVPVEAPGAKLRRKRSEGPVAIIPKIAITSLNEWTIKSGFDPCLFYDIDMLYPNDDDIRNFFAKHDADIIGLSAVVSTSYRQVKRISKIIREVNKKALLVCGGYLTAAAHVLLHRTEVDVCVVGDGEITWAALLNYVQQKIENGKKINIDVDKLKEIKGIAILDKNKKLIFTGYGGPLPSKHTTFPSFDYLKSGLQGNDAALNNYFRPFYLNETFVTDDRAYEKHRKPLMYHINVTKGCVAKCTFCQRGAKGYTVYNLEGLEEHILLLKKYNVGFLSVDDENFGSNKKYTYEVAKLFHKHDMLWHCTGVRCTSVNKEDIKFYKEHGCVSLQFGIESGSQVILDIMEKKFKVDDIKKALFSCYEADIYSPPVGFMVGMPGETFDTAKETGKLMGEIVSELRVPVKQIFGNLDIYYALPLYGTPLYEYGRKLNLLGKTLDEEEKYLELVSNVSIFKRYYINLNGAPMSEVVFFDILVFLEATRTFVKLMKNKELDLKMVKKLNRTNENQLRNPHVGSKDTEESKNQIFGGGVQNVLEKNKFIITNFIKKNIAFNVTIAKYVPRIILYPLVRYALYLEYIYQKAVLKDKNNIHRTTNARVDPKIRIKKEDVDFNSTTQIARSLRSIVKRKFANTNQDLSDTALNRLIGGP